MDGDFLHTTLRAVGKPVHRLGLSAGYGLDERGVREAFASGINYVFWSPTGASVTRVLRTLSADERDRLILATGPTLGFFPGAFRRRVDKVLQLLRADYLDVLQLYWLSRTSALTDAVAEELIRLRECGKVRALGTSIHDRPRAGRLAEDSPLDLFMIRYNAAHPGAETDIFPHLERRPPPGPTARYRTAPASIVAYTATSWRKLLKKPRGFVGPAATAGDCYRFCLSSPHVEVVLTGPASVEQLRANLAAVSKGPLDEAEMRWMRELGKAAR